MSDTAKNEIERLEHERCRVLMARDLAALAALVDEDLVHIHASGRIETKAEYLRGVEQRFVFRDVARQDLVVRVYGDIAVATGGLTQLVEIVGTPEERRMKAVVTQVWRLRDGAWRQISFQATNA
ncbi:MAG TPA: nuclear transport factor 2 family protein [Stellaceae bacterium]